MLKPVLSVLLLSFACMPLVAQQDLPSAPVPVAPKPANPFVLPPATPHNAVPDDEPKAPRMVCDAPATGLYKRQPRLTAEQEKAVTEYRDLISESIRREWYRRMPVSVRDNWMKGKEVQVRFAVLPDGSYDPAIVTRGSGRNSWDKHATEAVNAYANFPVPPQTGHPLIFCIRFRYDTDGSLSKPKPWTPTPDYSKSSSDE